MPFFTRLAAFFCSLASPRALKTAALFITASLGHQRTTTDPVIAVSATTTSADIDKAVITLRHPRPQVPKPRLGRAMILPTFCLIIMMGAVTAGTLYGGHLQQAAGSAYSEDISDGARGPMVGAAANKLSAVADEEEPDIEEMSYRGEPKEAANPYPNPIVVPPLQGYKYDIALSTGYRSLYGATFASCLVGLMASGAMLHARALHLLLSDAKLLNMSLLHNLAHMGTNVRMHPDMSPFFGVYPPRLLRVPDLLPGGQYGSTPASNPAHRQLAADAGLGPGPGPGAGATGSAVALGGSDLPSVFLEDDVWPVDDFPRKMHLVASLAAVRTGGLPFVIKLYLHSGTYGYPAVIRAEHAKTCNVTVTQFPIPEHPEGNSDFKPAFKGAVEGGPGAVLVTAFPRSSGSSGDAGNSTDTGGSTGSGDGDPSLSGYRPIPRIYKWGAQGLYFSDGLTRRRLADCYLHYTARSFEKQRRYKDWPLKMCLADLNINVYDSGRSLVQHIGAASSLFGDASTNSRYHRACSFPFLEKLPSEDEQSDWH
ncbi:hypothetical protein VOLCADRAFT_120734 [Volvox carteri f. nagariensis]|uniref:Uncharacterized protein n=1 Tax=Volvox carteri f. nagariensis TaxID=3068 RepID=D8TSB2_VOLCA|nr:uncharacterized protein VOLCADRAFT_120734 [Volvox carteri f. nagariensis]EFJ49663.1 hypothetical protein VOLCADRAFT_120734 [Volvox carteri f. nagariensis]|eukprot:XP_002949170.1 hypothetical protein VOLCADRAFT_120734 [Volvox carteri f. nagariensis]